MFSITAIAQIVYTDVNPDSVIMCTYTGGCSAPYSLDLNKDGINDFILAPRDSLFDCTCNKELASGAIDSAVISSTSLSWIADTSGGYAINTLIDSSLGWTNAHHLLALNPMNCVPTVCRGGSGYTVGQTPATGPWVNVSGKYLALKIHVGPDFFYGWIKLGVALADYTVSITIMEYGYNTTPNQPILAGQTVATGVIENSFASSISLYPNPATNHLTIALPKTIEKVKVTITDISGKIIYSTAARDTQKIKVSTRDFSEGVYVVQIQTSDLIGTKKLVVEK